MVHWQKQPHETYFYEISAIVSACKMTGTDDTIGWITNNAAKTDARADKHQTVDSFLKYLSTLDESAALESSQFSSGKFTKVFKNHYFEKTKTGTTNIKNQEKF